MVDVMREDLSRDNAQGDRLDCQSIGADFGLCKTGPKGGR